MSELNVELLVQTFNEKIATLMSELVVKETMIKQLNAEKQSLMDAIRMSRYSGETDEEEIADEDGNEDEDRD